MKNHKQTQSPGYANHGRPVTRRDLLAQGAISWSAYLATPSILTIFANRAMGQDAAKCASPAAAASKIPFIIIDLAGGSNLAGTNFIVGDKGGQMSFLPAASYASIGLTAAKAPGATGVTLNNEFGIAMHPDSKILAGMVAATTAPTRAKVSGTMFCTQSGDDTNTNPHSPLYWIAKAGARGELVSLVGTEDGPTAGRAAAPAASIDPSLRPSRVQKPADALGLVDPGKLANLITAVSSREVALKDVEKVLAATRTMSEARLKKFQEKDLPSQVKDLVGCGYLNSTTFLSKFQPALLDASQDAMVTGRFTALANNADEQKAATIAKLVLDGYAGAGVISLGGYDYHGQGRATQDTRDQAVGQLIGRILELAALKQKNVMVYVYTDGGVSANVNDAPVNGILPFTSDSGQRSAAVLLAYGVEKKPELRNGRTQIGAYSAAGAVDTTANKISNSVDLLTQAVVANYLAAHGEEGNLAKVVGANNFGAELDQYLAFAKII